MMGKLGSPLIAALAVAGVLSVLQLPIASGSEDAIAADPCNTTVTNETISLASMKKGLCRVTVQRNASTTPQYTTLSFSTINLQGDDFLVIYDGNYWDDANKVVNITGMKGPLTVVVHSPTAYLDVQIKKDNSTSTIQTTISDTGCEIAQALSSAAYVQSPTFLPGRTAFTCSYTINNTDSSSGLLALSFLEVKLPNATLNVTTSKGVNPVSGTTKPSDMYSSDNLQMLLSVQNANVTQMFSASVAPVTSGGDCGTTKNITGSLDLTINVPQLHAVSYDCRVTLSAMTGQSLFLNITSLSLTSGGDRVVIVDGASMGGSVLASLTQASAGYIVLSSGKQVIVRLVADELIGQRSLAFTVTELTTVNRLYQNGNFVIDPPTSGPSATRYFALEVDANSVVQFNLGAQNASKKYDYSVRVYDGCQTSSPLLVTFSSAVRFPVLSTGSSMLVVADISNTSQSVSGSFSNATAGCDSVTSASSGSFKLKTSPKVPAKCRWTISQPKDAVQTASIVLDLTTVKLEKNATVSVYSGVEGSGSLVAQLTASNTMPGATLPRITLPAAKWAQLVFSSGNSGNLTSVAVQARFQIINTLCGGQLSGPTGRIRSPGFPNLYPLNALCKWTFPSAAPGRLLFFDFPQFQLAPNHTFQFVEQVTSNSSRVVGTFGGAAALPDFMYKSNLTNTLTFNAQRPGQLGVVGQVAQGFDIQYWVLKCGGNQSQATGSFSTPKYPTPVPLANGTLCAWVITVAPKTGNKVNIVRMQLQVQTMGKVSLKDVIKMYDGNTLRNPLTFNFTDEKTFNFSSRYNSFIIVFNNTASSLMNANASIGLQVNYTTHACNMTCANGICLHPEWVCNNVNDCGDGTDEKNCTLPPPQPSKRGSGVKPGVVVVLFFVGLLVGAIIAFVIPRILRRYRTTRYTSFNNEPERA